MRTTVAHLTPDDLGRFVTLRLPPGGEVTGPLESIRVDSLRETVWDGARRDRIVCPPLDAELTVAGMTGTVPLTTPVEVDR